ncbi:hypothetical protein TCAL_16076 [Tigriopus californicus]|uniref:Uncharacterized protein n=1 Tax=Tigriopus californicus TaxID=6832 RepID=A0A553PQF3_TIGCA|nr:hypothetical protein TCAL_16076 [Tigriopus californicus]
MAHNEGDPQPLANPFGSPSSSPGFIAFHSSTPVGSPRVGGGGGEGGSQFKPRRGARGAGGGRGHLRGGNWDRFGAFQDQQKQHLNGKSILLRLTYRLPILLRTAILLFWRTHWKSRVFSDHSNIFHENIYVVMRDLIAHGKGTRVHGETPGVAAAHSVVREATTGHSDFSREIEGAGEDTRAEDTPIPNFTRDRSKEKEEITTPP